MGRFVEQGDVREVRAAWWSEDECVVIKVFSYLDRQYISAAATTMVPSEDGATAVTVGANIVQVDLEALDRALLERGIASWTLQNAQGKEVPMTRSAIARLSDQDGAYIVAQIVALNPRRSAAEEAGFRGAAGGGATGREVAS